MEILLTNQITHFFLIMQVTKFRWNINKILIQKVYLYFCNHFLLRLIYLNYISICSNIQIFNLWIVRSASVNLHFVNSVVKPPSSYKTENLPQKNTLCQEKNSFLNFHWRLGIVFIMSVYCIMVTKCHKVTC